MSTNETPEGSHAPTTPTPPAHPSRFSGRFEPTPADLSRFSGRYGEMEERDLSLPVPDDLHPNAGVRVRKRRRLQLVASQQGGCFTIAQAAAAGYDRRARYHHLTYGNWRPTVAPKVFRLTGWPIDELEQHHAWLLWAGPTAAFTSWTALALFGIERPEQPAAAPLDLVRARPLGRRDRLDRSPADAGVVRFHVQWARHRHAQLVDGLVVRPLDEALCVAMQSAPGPAALRVASAVGERLMDEGLVDVGDMVDTARAMRCARALEAVWPRFTGRSLPAA